MRLAALRRRGIRSTRTLFLDGHLLALGLLWGLFRSAVPSPTLALLALEGPKRYAGQRLAAPARATPARAIGRKPFSAHR